MTYLPILSSLVRSEIEQKLRLHSFDASFEHKSRCRESGHSVNLAGFLADVRSCGSLLRRVRRPANMQVAQIMQRRLIVLVHSTGEIPVAQSAVARRFPHILPDAAL